MPTPTALEDKLRELALFPPTTMPFLSVYINAQPDQHGRDNFEPFLRKELKARGGTYPARSAERESFDRDAERILSWLQTELRASSNGAAIFACAGSGDFFEALQFDSPFEHNELFVYHQPHLYELAKMQDQNRPYAAVIADTNSARIFVFGLGRTLDADTVSSPKVRSRSVYGGWWLQRFQLKVENEHLRHAKEVLKHLERIVREEKIDRVILAGDEVILSVLRENLPPFLAGKVVDELKLDITTPEHKVLQATLESMRQEDARTDAERVNAMIGAYRAGGLGLIGVEPVQAALANGQVDTLFIGPTVEAAEPKEEPADSGGSLRDAMVTRAYQTGAQVRFIEDPNLLANAGGVGATLRYRTI